MKKLYVVRASRRSNRWYLFLKSFELRLESLGLLKVHESLHFLTCIFNFGILFLWSLD